MKTARHLERIILQLTSLTSDHKVKWQFRDDEYSLSSPICVRIGWRWWYGEDDITLDKQVFCIHLEGKVIPICIGSESMAFGITLLSSISDDWAQHFLRAFNASVSHCQLGDKMVIESNVPLFSNLRNTLLGLEVATTSGKIRWKKLAAKQWQTYAGDCRVVIEMLTPIDDSEQAIPNTVARMTIGGSQVLVSAGTELMTIIHTILAEFDDDWRRNLVTEIQVLENVLRILEAL